MDHKTVSGNYCMDIDRENVTDKVVVCVVDSVVTDVLSYYSGLSVARLLSSALLHDLKMEVIHRYKTGPLVGYTKPVSQRQQDIMGVVRSKDAPNPPRGESETGCQHETVMLLVSKTTDGSYKAQRGLCSNCGYSLWSVEGHELVRLRLVETQSQRTSFEPH